MSGETDLQEDKKRPQRVLDIRGLFNPVDCRSIGTIRDELAEITAGAILEVLGNRFQHREVEAWCKKFGHPIVQVQDDAGLVKIWIQKGVR